MTYYEYEARCKALEAALRLNGSHTGADLVKQAEIILVFIGIPVPMEPDGASYSGGVGAQVDRRC